jgi:hypothetical protein
MLAGPAIRARQANHSSPAGQSLVEAQFSRAEMLGFDFVRRSESAFG